MKRPTAAEVVAALLSFNGGFVDAVGYFGLEGLFIAHVTGNFVTLAAALVQGSHGNIGKVLALPEFVLVIALARVAGTALRAWKLPALPILLSVKVLLLFGFFVMAVSYGPFPDANTPAALITALCGISAMAVQNAVGRVHYAHLPPTTVMTNTTVQATLDAVDLLIGGDSEQNTAVRVRFRRLALALVSFGVGCAVAAILYSYAGFWCLGLAVVIGAGASLIRGEAPTPAL
jgi:uncharacterized membrane protein YoaK (UPF0700 family)